MIVGIQGSKDTRDRALFPAPADRLGRTVKPATHCGSDQVNELLLWRVVIRQEGPELELHGGLPTIYWTNSSENARILSCNANDGFQICKRRISQVNCALQDKHVDNSQKRVKNMQAWKQLDAVATRAHITFQRQSFQRRLENLLFTPLEPA